jgi:hypothetical protein
MIETGAPKSVLWLTPYSLQRSRWFLGDDFGANNLRFNLAWNRGLGGIELDRPIDEPQDDSHGL